MAAEVFHRRVKLQSKPSRECDRPVYEFLDDIRKEIADFLKNASDEEHDAFFYDMVYQESCDTAKRF